MRLDKLILQVTDNCPLECSYCCVESGPWRTTTMARDAAIDWVRQAHAINPDVLLSFTGGEPFVRFTVMRDIARAAWDLGIPHTSITSAIWCKSREFARAKLAELQEAGLGFLSISYDEYHLPWVDDEKIQNCVYACNDLGLKTAVAGSVTKTSKGAVELAAAWSHTVPNVQFYDGPVQPQGRGALIPLESLLVEDWGESNAICPAPADLLIHADGTAYPCCSTGGDYEYLKLGNAHETSIAELRARADRQPWLRIAATQGFAEIERIVHLYDPELQFPHTYIGTCDLCKIVLGSDERSHRVRAALLRYEQDRARVTTSLFGRIAGALAAPAPAR